MGRWWETWALIAVVVLIIAVAMIFLSPITSTMFSGPHCPSATPSGGGCI